MTGSCHRADPSKAHNTIADMTNFSMARLTALARNPRALTAPTPSIFAWEVPTTSAIAGLEPSGLALDHPLPSLPKSFAGDFGDPPSLARLQWF
jgi:hypothetical protein